MKENRKGNTSSTIVPALDMQAHMAWAQAWSSISPESSLLAWTDWASHLANSPGKQSELLSFAGSLSEQWMSLLKKSLVSPDQEVASPEPSPPMTVVSTIRHGINGPTTFSAVPFLFNPNGGSKPRKVYGVLIHNTNAYWRLAQSNGWKWYRRPTLRFLTPLS